MAVVMNVYDQLIGSISKFFKDWKKNLLFLIPILIGAGAGIFLFSLLLGSLLENYPMPVNFFFLGLILGSIPMIYKRATAGKFRATHLIPFAAALLVMIGFTVISITMGTSTDSVTASLSIGLVVKLVICCAIAAFSMLLPGVSGSMMMVLFGVYGIIMGAISQLNIPILIPVAIGVLIGLLFGARLIDVLLERFPQATFWAILGLIVGSLFSVYSAAGFAFNLQGLISVLTLIAGAVISFLFGWEKLQDKIKSRKGISNPSEEQQTAQKS